jgi:hypothetical protein
MQMINDVYYNKIQNRLHLFVLFPTQEVICAILSLRFQIRGPPTMDPPAQANVTPTSSNPFCDSEIGRFMCDIFGESPVDSYFRFSDLPLGRNTTYVAPTSTEDRTASVMQEQPAITEEVVTVIHNGHIEKRHKKACVMNNTLIPCTSCPGGKTCHNNPPCKGKGDCINWYRTESGRPTVNGMCSRCKRKSRGASGIRLNRRGGAGPPPSSIVLPRALLPVGFAASRITGAQVVCNKGAVLITPEIVDAVKAEAKECAGRRETLNNTGDPPPGEQATDLGDGKRFVTKGGEDTPIVHGLCEQMLKVAQDLEQISREHYIDKISILLSEGHAKDQQWHKDLLRKWMAANKSREPVLFLLALQDGCAINIVDDSTKEEYRAVMESGDSLLMGPITIHSGASMGETSDIRVHAIALRNAKKRKQERRGNGAEHEVVDVESYDDELSYEGVTNNIYLSKLPLPIRKM